MVPYFCERIYITCKLISNQIFLIRYANDILDKGNSELEALYLYLQSGKVTNKQEAHAVKGAIIILHGQNDFLAQKINSALKEVELTLRKRGGSKIYKEFIHEFAKVLKESIRILHDHQIIQESYSIEKSESIGARATFLQRKSNRGKELGIVDVNCAFSDGSCKLFVCAFLE